MSHATVVFNSGMIVFREGLEAILIFAAVTAELRGREQGEAAPGHPRRGALLRRDDRHLVHRSGGTRRRVTARTKLEASPASSQSSSCWSSSTGSSTVSTGRTGSARHHRRRQKLLTETGIAALIELVVLLGFTTVYREGFEVVLFLQNLQLQSGTSTVLEGVAIGLACTAVVGVITFWLHHKLPYRKMLILTGALVAVVLMVMIGGTALSFMDLGWIPSHPTPFSVPEWMGTWFEIYPYWETIGAQILAGLLVVGSYLLAENVKVRRRVQRGEQPAVRAEAPPPLPQAQTGGA
jgi:high-affinity iron transporter